MKITVFGATGRVGSEFLRLACDAGHVMSALVRDPSRLDPDCDVRAVVGDARDAEPVRDAIGGADAVVSSIGVNDISQPFTTQSDAMRTIVDAMEALGVRRIAVVGGGGILDHPDGGLRQEQPGFPATFRHVSDEHHRVWKILEGSSLDWVIAACPDIVDEPATGEWLEERDRRPEGGQRRIPIGDVAAFLLREVERPHYIRTRVGLAT